MSIQTRVIHDLISSDTDHQKHRKRSTKNLIREAKRLVKRGVLKCEPVSPTSIRGANSLRHHRVENIKFIDIYGNEASGYWCDLTLTTPYGESVIGTAEDSPMISEKGVMDWVFKKIASCMAEPAENEYSNELAEQVEQFNAMGIPVTPDSLGHIRVKLGHAAYTYQPFNFNKAIIEEVSSTLSGDDDIDALFQRSVDIVCQASSIGLTLLNFRDDEVVFALHRALITLFLLGVMNVDVSMSSQGGKPLKAA